MPLLDAEMIYDILMVPKGLIRFSIAPLRREFGGQDQLWNQVDAGERLVFCSRCKPSRLA